MQYYTDLQVLTCRYDLVLCTDGNVQTAPTTKTIPSDVSYWLNIKSFQPDQEDPFSKLWHSFCKTAFKKAANRIPPLAICNSIILASVSYWGPLPKSPPCSYTAQASHDARFVSTAHAFIQSIPVGDLSLGMQDSHSVRLIDSGPASRESIM